MMSRSLSQTGETKRRFNWPTGTPQIAALLVVLLVDTLVAPHFFQIIVQDGRLFGSPIDIFKPAARWRARHWYDAGDRHRRDRSFCWRGDGHCRGDGINDRGRAQPAGGCWRR